MRFLDTEGIKPLITKDVRGMLESPVLFEYKNTKIYGYEATTLQKIVKAIAKLNCSFEDAVKMVVSGNPKSTKA